MIYIYSRGRQCLREAVQCSWPLEHFTVKLDQLDARDNATNKESRASAMIQSGRKPL